MKNVLLTLMALGLIFVSACSEPADEPEEITVEDVSDAAEDAADDAADAVEDAADEM